MVQLTWDPSEYHTKDGSPEAVLRDRSRDDTFYPYTLYPHTQAATTIWIRGTAIQAFRVYR